MSEIILSSSKALSVPAPKEELATRLATDSDIPWMDELQKKYSKNLGFMPKLWLENKIKAGHILIGEINLDRVGYVIAQDRYLKRDELGIVYQLVVVPGKQRSFIGAALLKAQFDRSGYGCRLYCCWCAQDLAANHFWESMGFVPLAYRNGAEKKGKNGKPRVQIFWQKKIRGNEDGCHWWFPAKTEAGAMGADRLALPIPPGVHWSEVEPIEIPLLRGDRSDEDREMKALGDQSRSGRKSPNRRGVEQSNKKKTERQPLTGGIRFAPLPSVEEKVEQIDKPKKARKPKAKIDPKFIAASRELRDKYLEQVNEKGFRLESAGKYELTRATTNPQLNLNHAETRTTRLLEAA